MAQRSFLKNNLLLVGGSAGSLDAILHLLPALQSEVYLTIVLVIHRQSGESVLSGLLRDRTTWPVREAEEKEPILPGTVYIAPAGYHLLIEKNKTFSLDYSEKVHFSRPSIDVTFETAADAYGSAVIALLLSGANTDGTSGLIKIKAAGGFVMVQQLSEAPVVYMPQHAIENVQPDVIVRVAEIPAIIQGLNAYQ